MPYLVIKYHIWLFRKGGLFLVLVHVLLKLTVKLLALKLIKYKIGVVMTPHCAEFYESLSYVSRFFMWWPQECLARPSALIKMFWGCDARLN